MSFNFEVLNLLASFPKKPFFMIKGVPTMTAFSALAESFELVSCGCIWYHLWANGNVLDVRNCLSSFFTVGLLIMKNN